MKKLLKKLLLSFLVFLLLTTSNLSLFASSARAESDTFWYNQPFVEWYLKVYDTTNPSEIFGERYTAAQVQWVIWSLISFPLNFFGKDNQEIINCFLKEVGGTGVNIIECGKGAIGAIKNIIDLIWPGSSFFASNQRFSPIARVLDANDRPISGIRYVKGLIGKFSPVTEVKAQGGFGYSAISAVQKYWAGFRNMAYAIIVLVVIIFAFMIMFRVKLSPQTVISVQSALPKIIVVVILATFSYAIAGFLIDFTYVIAGLFATLLYSSGFAIPGKDLYGIYEQIIPNTALLGNFYILGYMIWYTILFAIALVWSFVTILTQASVWGALASIVMIVVWAFLIILCIWYTIKIPWVLIKTLISIYISIVLAPIQIIAGALVPQAGFGQWFKKLATELLVFPVTGLFLYLAMSTLLSSFAVNCRIIGLGPLCGSTDPGKLWAPSIIGSSADMSGLLWLAVSFGIIIMLPKVVDMLKGLIMGEKFSFGTAMGEAVGVGRAAWGLTGAPFVGQAREAFSIANAPRVWGKLADWTYGRGEQPSRVSKIFTGAKTRAEGVAKKTFSP